MRFSKMQGLGNDFMVIDGVTQDVTLSPSLIQRWGDRRYGIGFDQCLIIEPSTIANADFNYRIFNNDGSEVGQCGNGARCVARFIKEQGISCKETITLATLTTTLKTMVHDNLEVSLWLAPASFRAADIPIKADTHSNPHQVPYQDTTLKLYCLTVGNPHAVMLVNDFRAYDLEALGAYFNQHSFFPEGVNLSFLHQHSNTDIEIRTFERGSGITTACGSAATAAFVVAHRFLGLASKACVNLTNGALQFNWENEQEAIEMRGPAELVFDGVIKV